MVECAIEGIFYYEIGCAYNHVAQQNQVGGDCCETVGHLKFGITEEKKAKYETFEYHNKDVVFHFPLRFEQKGFFAVAVVEEVLYLQSYGMSRSTYHEAGDKETCQQS